MAKVMYNGEVIELDDKLEFGYEELDMLIDDANYEEKLENTMELNYVNLDDTMEINLDDTQEFELGDMHE